MINDSTGITRPRRKRRTKQEMDALRAEMVKTGNHLHPGTSSSSSRIRLANRRGVVRSRIPSISIGQHQKRPSDLEAVKNSVVIPEMVCFDWFWGDAVRF